jgi:hypothetical protein
MRGRLDPDERLQLCADLTQQRLDNGEQFGFTTDLRHQPRGKRAAVAGVQPGERRGPPLAARLDVPDALQTQKSLDPVDVSHPLVQQGLARTVQALEILLLRARHAHDAAGLRLAAVQSHQHAHQTLGVCAVCLHVAAAPADLDTRRIDDLIADAMGVQQSMQPEAVISSLIAGVDLDSRNAPSDHHLAGALEDGEQTIDIAAGELEQAYLVLARQMERDHPARLAEFDCSQDLRGGGFRDMIGD